MYGKVVIVYLCCIVFVICSFLSGIEVFVDLFVAAFTIEVYIITERTVFIIAIGKAAGIKKLSLKSSIPLSNNIVWKMVNIKIEVCIALSDGFSHFSENFFSTIGNIRLVSMPRRPIIADDIGPTNNISKLRDAMAP